MGHFSLYLFSFGILCLLFVRRRRSRRRKVRGSAELDWSGVAAAFFERHADSRSSTADRMHQALTTALRHLELSHCLVALHEGERFRVLHLSSRGYSAVPALWVGKEVAASEYFCGVLGPQREQMAVDVASISGWRLHPSCRLHGWESYIGVRRALSGDQFLTVSCFDMRPRDQLFSAADKQLLHQVGAWVESVWVRQQPAPVFDTKTSTNPPTQSVS